MFEKRKKLAALALAYALTGWVALQIAVPPGYAAPIFPSAGIALSALLIWGQGLWPAVALGSLVVQFLVMWQSGLLDGPWGAAFLIPVGAALQAWVGAWAARRWIGFPHPLDTPRSILRFLGVIAPLSCLISPSIAVPSLWLFGTLDPSSMVFNWWNWWLGDTLGVMIAAPLMFAFFGSPVEDWRSRRAGVVVPMGVALVLLAFALAQVRDWEARRLHGEFSRAGEHIASIVKKRLDVQVDMMLAIERLFATSEEVTREDFREFVSPWLVRYPGTQNFGWSPLVQGAARDAFEQAVRDSGVAAFRILGRDASGETFPAPTASEYLPLTYIEPLRGNERALGLNTLHLPATAQAIQRARASGQPSASAAIRLVQEPASQAQNGVVVYLPVSVRGRLGSEVGAALELGVVSGVFRMDDSIATARALADDSNILLCIIDREGAAGPQRLVGPAGCEADAWLSGALQHVVSLPFAGRDWSLAMLATRDYADAQRSWAVWITIAVALLSVGMLGAFLLITTGNARRTHLLVGQRTAELADATERLREKQVALAEAQRLAHLGSWQSGPGGEGLDASEELRRMLGLEGEVPRTLEALVACVAESDRERLQEAIDAARARPERLALDCVLQGRAERIVAIQIEGDWREGRLLRLRGTVQDVTGQHTAQARIHYLARFDTLTGLPNRAAWMEQAQTLLTAAHRHHDVFAVLFLDLDNFKNVNDSLGHPVGDQLLATVAQRLGYSLRQEDMLARLGGDEFVALLPRLGDASEAALTASKLLAVLSQPVRIDALELLPSVSIGIAVFPNDGFDVDTLLKHADTAMYAAKACGRNNYQFFVPEMNARARLRIELEGALRTAIERDQLVLHYQPQIDAVTGAMVGVEALVRWQHPERGLIPPGEFIPVAEDSGIIVALGEWVMREAFRQQARWQGTPMAGVSISINISPLQFVRGDLMENLARALALTGADPSRIELEITESALMRPSGEIAGVLGTIRGWGMKLALDDFGTGFSSLAYLKRLPLTRLKIDASFVAGLPDDPEDVAVTSAILSLARDLGLEVVAEGVETETQQRYLVDRHCGILQGYLFARPLSVEALEAAFDRGQFMPALVL